MSLEASILQLTLAVETLTKQLQNGTAPSQPGPAESTSKPTKESKKKSAAASESATASPVAAIPAEPAAIAPAATESIPSPQTAAVSPEVQQKAIADKLLSLAKTDRDGVVALLSKYKAARFAQVKVSDYPAFGAELDALEASIKAAQAAKASTPESLV